MSEFLLEIGMEEIPARFLWDLSKQLETRMVDFLTAERLTFGTIKAFATPRRLAVIVSGLAESQPDISEKAKGPALKIAKNEAGEWTKAAQGFVKGQGASVTDIVIETIKGEDYIFVNREVKGQATAEVLARVDQVIGSMVFPVSMNWNQYETPYIRPVHWIVALLDDQVIPISFVGVHSSNVSKGHRFLGHDTTISRPLDYVAQLRKQFVLVDFDERRNLIRQQLSDLAAEQQWHVPVDEALLDEVTAIVEWPTVFYGDFEEKYLAVPHIVLITAMRDHQRYFYAESLETHTLLPIFISVRNGNAEHLKNVVKGNQKVLRARLEDALFFYQEDLKHDLDYFVTKLTAVNEHFKLGSLADKQKRVRRLIGLLQAKLGLSDETVAPALRAAEIYKFDLMTQVVGEFDELQGQIGAIYARLFGESDAVAQAIGTQYLPITSGGELPDSPAGALLAVADKLDTLMQYFNVGLVPTGSNDPYALRRQAMGILAIVLDQAWVLDLAQLFDELCVAYEVAPELGTQLTEFIQARMQKHLARLQAEHDLIQAVIAARHLMPKRLLAVATILKQQKAENPERYRQIIESLTRVVNLGIKVEMESAIDLAKAETESEKNLMNAVLALRPQESVEKLYEDLSNLSAVIDRYFEENKVIADDELIKQNRLATLKVLTDSILSLMDPRQLISKF